MAELLKDDLVFWSNKLQMISKLDMLQWKICVDVVESDPKTSQL